MASILEGKQNVELPRFIIDNNRPNTHNLQYGNMRLMKKPDENSYLAWSVNYNDKSYHGQALGHNPNRAGTVFTYDEQGRVIELTSGRDTKPCSNQVQYHTND